MVDRERLVQVIREVLTEIDKEEEVWDAEHPVEGESDDCEASPKILYSDAPTALLDRVVEKYRTLIGVDLSDEAGIFNIVLETSRNWRV